MTFIIETQNGAFIVDLGPAAGLNMIFQIDAWCVPHFNMILVHILQ